MMLSISRKRLIAIIVTEVIKSKHARLIDIELAFLFDSMSRINRTPRLLWPKTMAYWTDILMTRASIIVLNLIFAFCDLRSIDCLVSYNNILTIYPPQTPTEIQVGIVIQRLANHLGYRQLEQMFGVSQGSVAYFTERFIEAILDTLPAYVVGVCIIKDPRFFCFLGIA